MTVADALIVALAYVLGCMNAGYYLLRWRDGRDIRDQGSGNAGAKNVGRLLGRQAFLLTFALDAAKGALAVTVAQYWAPAMVPWCALAVVAGHVWPVQLGGRGGKGVATALGALTLLAPLMLAALAGVFALGWLVSRRVAAAGIVAFWIMVPVATLVSTSRVAFACLGLSVLLTYTHRRPARPSPFQRSA